MNSQWQPYHEPARTTAMRTLSIAAAIGVVVASLSHGRISWLAAFAIALWPSVAGHWVELWFLNWLRPRLPSTSAVQLFARIIVWLVAGALFAFLMTRTSALFTGSRAVIIPMWIGAVGFVGVELLAHVGLHVRRLPSVYDQTGMRRES
jgi:hypothetical protein